jgi:hypothetical protein
VTRDELVTIWTPVGVDYCTAHHGTRNEDDEWCDWREDPDVNLCETCDGEGSLFVDDGEPDVDCPDCDTFGYTPCELQQLGYLTEKAP